MMAVQRSRRCATELQMFVPPTYEQPAGCAGTRNKQHVLCNRWMRSMGLILSQVARSCATDSVGAELVLPSADRLPAALAVNLSFCTSH
jgi:hypothetical protein